MTVHHRIFLATESWATEPGLDTAVSEALLRAVGRGDQPETLRLYRPAREVAFGPRDQGTPGFERACTVAREHGFTPITRLAGGRAAIFHEDTIAFAWSSPEVDVRTGIDERYRTIAAIIRDALASLGVDARIGEVPGEYCPGAWSVNAGGTIKLAGVGQRLVRGAAHVGGVIVVDRGDLVRDVLIPVYDALGLSFDTAAVGAVRDVRPEATWEAVVEALAAQFGQHADLEPGELPRELVQRARADTERFIGP